MMSNNDTVKDQNNQTPINSPIKDTKDICKNSIED